MKTFQKRQEPVSVILVVDDEPTVLNCACDILLMHGYRILASPGGVPALNLYQEQWQTIDLILTDLMMPDLNGLEMLQAMEAINPQLKAIVMSGSHNLTSMVNDCALVGACLAKPFSMEQLTEEIGRLLADGAIDTQEANVAASSPGPTNFIDERRIWS